MRKKVGNWIHLVIEGSKALDSLEEGEANFDEVAGPGENRARQRLEAKENRGAPWICILIRNLSKSFLRAGNLAYLPSRSFRDR